MPLSCAYVHLCSTQVCATYLPGKCSLSGRVSTTKFTKTQGGRGSQACANAFSSASVSAQANRAGCFIKAAHDELSAMQQREGRLQLSSCKIVVMG